MKIIHHKSLKTCLPCLQFYLQTNNCLNPMKETGLLGKKKATLTSGSIMSENKKHSREKKILLILEKNVLQHFRMSIHQI
jgi:hypothetical protein